MGGRVTSASREKEADMKWPQAQGASGALGEPWQALTRGGPPQSRADDGKKLEVGRTFQAEGTAQAKAQGHSRTHLRNYRGCSGLEYRVSRDEA